MHPQSPGIHLIGQHHADQPRTTGLGILPERLAAQAELAVQQRPPAAERLQQRRFTGAVRAEQAGQLAGTQRKRQTLVHTPDTAPAEAVADREALSGYHATTHHQLKYCIRFWFTIT